MRPAGWRVRILCQKTSWCEELRFAEGWADPRCDRGAEARETFTDWRAYLRPSRPRNETRLFGAGWTPHPVGSELWQLRYFSGIRRRLHKRLDWVLKGSVHKYVREIRIFPALTNRVLVSTILKGCADLRFRSRVAGRARSGSRPQRL